MKQKYTTPAIEIEELIKEDVLLTSDQPSRPIINGIYNIEDSANGWTLENSL